MDKKQDSSIWKYKNQKPDKMKSKGTKNKEERQKSFDDNRNGMPEKKDDEKKQFDKKAYRLKKYSKKYKLEKWEEQRKKKMLLKYQKTLKNEQISGTYKPKSFDEDEPDSKLEFGRFVKHPDLIAQEKQSQIVKNDRFVKKTEQLNKIKQDKIEKQQAQEKAKLERMHKLQEYKKKKHDRYKKLSKKTKKGQPVMTGRLELLLEKIQGSK